MTETGIIHHGAAEDILPTIPTNSAGLVFTSPPYNIRAGGNWGNSKRSTWKRSHFHTGGYDGHDDDMPPKAYVEWQRGILRELLRILRLDGAIFYNHKWRVLDKKFQMHEEIIKHFPLRQIIIWDRDVKHNFCPHFYAPQYEVIYVIAHESWMPAKGHAAQGEVWRIRPENNTEHPAPFPLALARKVIAGNDAEVILDPVMGSGTTAIAAEAEGRKWIGIEKSARYVEMAEKRLDESRRQQVMDFG